MLPNLGRQRQHLPQRSPMLQRPLAGSLNHRPIRHRIAERHTQLNHVRPASIAASTISRVVARSGSPQVTYATSAGFL